MKILASFHCNPSGNRKSALEWHLFMNVFSCSLAIQPYDKQHANASRSQTFNKSVSIFNSHHNPKTNGNKS